MVGVNVFPFVIVALPLVMDQANEPPVGMWALAPDIVKASPAVSHCVLVATPASASGPSSIVMLTLLCAEEQLEPAGGVTVKRTVAVPVPLKRIVGVSVVPPLKTVAGPLVTAHEKVLPAGPVALAPEITKSGPPVSQKLWLVPALAVTG